MRVKNLIFQNTESIEAKFKVKKIKQDEIWRSVMETFMMTSFL